MKEQKQYNVGIYCRLSKDDIGKNESSSIISQKGILKKFVQDKNWNIFDYYVDDGHTGTNFNRPGFERLLEDIETGKVNAVVVKDLSRLGRNHIEADTFMEIYFPARNVRVVAVDDNIDSIRMEENNNDFVVPMKNMLNELYSRDLSRKIRSVVKAKKQKGDFLSNYAPYGYKKDPSNKNRLLVDEESAKTVRQIYEMAKSGLGSKKIAKALNEEEILSPRDYRDMVLGKYHQPNKKNICWNPETVVSILRSRIYLGDMVQGIYECSRFKRTPNKRKPKDEWIVTPNTHEPLVDTDTWEYIQKLIDARVRHIKSEVLQLFAGFVKCEDCGYSLAYSNSQNIEQYTCGQYRRHGKTFCTCHYIRKDVLEQVVLDDIRKYSKLAKTKGDELAKHLQSLEENAEAGQLASLEKELDGLYARNVELDNILKRLYEDNIKGRIPDDRFDKFLTDYEKEQANIKLQVEDIQKSISEVKANQKDSDSWIKLIRNYTKIKKLDRTILSELIDKITVGETKIVDGSKAVDVTIYYRFVGSIC